MNIRRFRLPMIAFALAAGFDMAYFIADFSGSLTLYFVTTAPPTVMWLWAWRPFALGVRLAKSLGYRFDYATGTAPWQFDVISRSAGLMITFGFVWLVLWLSTRLRERSKRRLKAA